MGVWCGPLTWHHLMADLETEWAGVLQRWGNSSEASLRQSDSLYRQTNTSDRQTYTKTHTESHARQSSSTRRNEYDRNSSYSSNNDNLDRPKSVTADRRTSLRQEDRRTVEKQEDRRTVERQEDRRTVERQTTRDRQERQGGQGSKAGARQRWGSVSRGSVSPGKENVETNGYRSRSATRSPTSRLYSSTVASRAKQITPVLTEALGHNRKTSTSSQRSSHSASSRGATPSRQTPHSEQYQTRKSASSKSFSSMHRSSSQRRSSVSPPSSSAYNNQTRKSSGSVKISLSSLKKASVESWDGGVQQRQGKKKSVSSVYIG